MKIETIQNHLREQGYFINRVAFDDDNVTENLCRKLDDGDYEVCRNVNTPNGLKSASDLLLEQINNNIILPGLPICSLNEILVVIDGTIFELYKMRERKIQQHIDLCQSVETENNELPKGRYVVKVKRPKGFNYFIVFEDSITEINEVFLEEKDRLNAVRIKYPKVLQTALKDDLNNEYEEKYLQECQKYKAI